MSDHAHWADAAGAYLLDALDDHEKAGYETHLAGCALCQEEVSLLSVASDALAMGVEQHEAPPELRDRIMAVVESEASLLRAAGPEADRVPVRGPVQERSRRWWQFVPRSGLALGATVLLIAGGVTGWALRDGGNDPLRTVVADVEVPGASASLIMREEHSTLIARKLPRPGHNRVYQVWLKRRGVAAPEPTDALFTVRHDGSASVDVSGSLKGVEAVLVTSEPEGGSQAPTTEPVIAAIPA
jgi:hypothetical protein